MIKQELVFTQVNVKLLRSASSLGGDLQSVVWEGARVGDEEKFR